jgi:hypothetical protein
MNAYCAEVRKLEADVLSKLGSKRALVRAGVFVQDLRKPSIRLLSDPEKSHSNMPHRVAATSSWRRPKMTGTSTLSPTS